MSDAALPIRLARLKDASEVRAELRDAERVVVDTEFHTERRFRPDLLLVQVAVPGRGVWILDPLVDGLLAEVGEALGSVPAWLVHAGTRDLQLLEPICGGIPDVVEDTQIAAGLVCDRYPLGLTALIRRFLGREPGPQATMSDWTRRPLGADQIAYAAEDVLLLPELYAALSERLDDLGRQALARQAFAEAAHEAIAPPDDTVLWRRLNIARSLTPEETAILAHLAAWRQRTARERNKPPPFILGHGALKQVCRLKPASLGALKAHRRIPDGVTKRYGAQILEVVAEARATDPSTWPAAVRPGTAEARLVSALGLLAEVEGAQQQHAPRLVLPERIREDLALRIPATREDLTSVLGPWRDPLLGEAVWGLLTGSLTISVQGGDVRSAPGT